MIHSFLLIGQSNMAGRGNISEALPVDIEHIKILRNGRWQRMFRPINPDRHFSGVSLAESFAEVYAKKYNVDVGLIPCADGGTCLEQWKEGGLLYENAVYQARLASRTSTIVGVLWHQGESDCADGLFDTYCMRFERIMHALRRDLQLHNVPFLVGGLGDFLKDCTIDPWVKNYQKVNSELKNIAERNERTMFVSAEGLTGKEDNLHFNSEALYAFGLRYFQAFESINEYSKTYIEKSEKDIIFSDMEEL